MITKTARVDIKTTHDAKALLEHAARTAGTTLSAFMLESSMVKAREILTQSHLIHLTHSESERFIHALENPPKANEKLKSLFLKFNPKEQDDNEERATEWI